MVKNEETTDLTLFVRTSSEDELGWDRQKIVDALILETYVDVDTAQQISIEVEKQIISSGISRLTAPLIRELVDAKLIERGLEQARRMHTRLGFPLYDVTQLIFHQNKENANLPHGPDGTNLILAEGIKKEYALFSVFSQDVADAHIRGDIHIHDLGYVDRPYSACQSIEYLKKFGLGLPHSFSVSKPAKHAEVLLAHMVRLSAALQGYFAGTIGWDAVNIFFAPYLETLTDREVEQIAQMLIYEFSQLAVARGGQAIFTEINLNWEIPQHFSGVPATGPGGETTGKTYGDYVKDARRFLWALLQVYREGDAKGKPFFFPKPLVHLTENFFETEGHEEFLKCLCDVAAEKGNPYFVFDREQTVKISRYGRLDFKTDRKAKEEAKAPWKMRYASIQNVTLNLPRLGYKSAGDDTRLFSMISEIMETAVKAHIEKKNFIERLLSQGDSGPLSVLAMNRNGSPYLKMDRASYLVGMAGLNELVQIHRGHEIHESVDAMNFGLKIIAHIKAVADKLGRRHHMRFVLEQTPAETTSYRFAKLDLKYHSPKSGHFVRGNIAKAEVYYTNSTQMNIAASLTPFERVTKEGRFHPLIDASAITHLWLGESRPQADVLARFITRVFKETPSEQIAFSPEFTSCSACGKTSRGRKETCPSCSSEEVDGISRVTGYFTHTSRLNKGKTAELRDMHRSGDFS